jgi:hypothetical protein
VTRRHAAARHSGLGERPGITHDLAPPMRSFFALLTLLLALPGLLLPVGALWHLCGCAAIERTVPTCCAAATAPREAAPVRSCCASKAKTPAERPIERPIERSGERDETPQFRADDCGCEWIPLADDQPVRNTPEPPPILLALPPQPAFEPARIAAAPSRVQAWVVRASRPPPPDEQRSLPLRL